MHKDKCFTFLNVSFSFLIFFFFFFLVSSFSHDRLNLSPYLINSWMEENRRNIFKYLYYLFFFLFFFFLFEDTKILCIKSYPKNVQTNIIVYDALYIELSYNIYTVEKISWTTWRKSDRCLISSSIEIANRNRCDVLTAEVLFCELDRDNYIYVCNKLAILLLGEKRELGKYMVVISADMRSHARCSIGWS